MNRLINKIQGGKQSLTIVQVFLSKPSLNFEIFLFRYQKDISAWNVKVQKMGYAEKISALEEKVSMLKKKSKEL